MTTKPIPSGTHNFSVNLPADTHRHLKRLATASDITAGQYLRKLAWEA